MSDALAAADAPVTTAFPSATAVPPPEPVYPDLVNKGQPALAEDTTVKAPPRLDPTWGELIGSAARQSNSIVSAFSNNMNHVDADTPEDGFDFQKAAKDAGHEGDGYLDRYAYVFNQRAADKLTAQIAKEQEDQRIVAASGIGGMFATGAAGILDWPTLIPGGELFDAAKAGEGVVASAVKVGAANALAVGAQEAALQGSQETRTPSESILNIGAGAVLGAAVGAAGSAFLPLAERAGLIARMDSELRAPEKPGEFDSPAPAARAWVESERAKMDAMEPQDRMDYYIRQAQSDVSPVASEPQSFAAAGAEVVKPQTLDDLSIAGNATRHVAENSWWSPALRLATHPYPEVRDAGEKMLDGSLYLNKHFGDEGSASPVSSENMTHQYMGKYAGAVEQAHDLWMQYRKGGGKLTKDKWWNEVGAALQEADQHAVPEVAKMSGIFRKEVFDPMTKDAIDAGLLPKDVKVETAASYFGRVWNRQKIIANESAFRSEKVRPWLEDNLKSSIAAATASRDRNIASINSQIADLTLPADQRAALLKSLPEQLAAHRAANGDFDALDEGLSDMRKAAAAAAERGDQKMADATNADIKRTVDVAGKDYADYVSKRAGIQNRMALLRRNVAGSEGEVERLRGKLIDSEQSNIGRLQRLHASLTKLDGEIADDATGGIIAKLADARTKFMQITERSNAAYDRLAKRTADLDQKANTIPDATKPQRAPVPPDLAGILEAARQPLGVRNPEHTMRAHPARDILRNAGGVDPESPLAGELRHMGITPQKAPGLFKKGGIGAADNIVASEHPIFARHAETDLAGEGYVPQDTLLAALRDESHGNPWRSEEEHAALQEYQQHVGAHDEYRQMLEDMGINLKTMNDKQIEDRLGDVAFQRRVIEQMDATPAPAGEHDAGAVAPDVLTKREADLAAKRERVVQLFDAAERKRIADLSKVSDRIGELEDSDPRAAADLLRQTIDERLAHTAEIIEREGVRMDGMQRRMEAADPKHAVSRVEELKARAQNVHDDFAAKMDGYDAENGGKSYLDGIEDHIVNSLTGRGKNPADLPHDLVVAVRGPLNARTFGIQDKLVRDYLDMNAERGVARYTRIMGGEIALARQFHDSPDLKMTIQKIEDRAALERAKIDAAHTVQSKAAAHTDADARAAALADQVKADKSLAPANGESEPTLRQQAALDNIEATRKAEHAQIDAAKTMTEDEKAKARTANDKARSKAITDLSAMRDILRGTYRADENSGPLARVLAVAGQFNYMTQLGGVVMSSLNDIAKPMMVHGLGRYMNDGLLPLISNLKAIRALHAEGVKGGALAEKVTQGMVATMAEITDPVARGTAFERFVANSARIFSKYGNFGLYYWDALKTMNYGMMSARVIENVRNFSKLSDSERAFMRLNHIDDTQASKIAAQLDKYASDVNGVTIANSDRWDDQAAREAFDGAMLTDARTNVVTPGVGDKPLAMHSPIGRAMGQFQSYTFAAHSKIFLRSMQGVEKGVDAGWAGVMAGSITAVSLGMLTYYLKTVEAGRELSDNPSYWLMQGLDRSGLLTAFFGVNNEIEKLSGYGAYGAMESLFPGRMQGLPAARYTNRSVAGTLAGPTGDLADKVLNLMVHTTQGKLGKQDATALKRLAPWNNIPEINWYINHNIMPAPVAAPKAH